jgi:signal transduction histidine kinase
MRERAELLRGRLSIESSPGTGTRILAELPLLGLKERSA